MGLNSEETTTRDRLLHCVVEAPGILKSDLTETLGLAWGTVDYHVRRLTSQQLLESAVVSRRVHLFARGYEESERRALAALRDPRALRIAAALVGRERGIGDLARELDWSRKVVARHVRHLRDGAIASELQGGRPMFRLTLLGRRLLTR